jgi:bacillithiol biosynthesis cysteine-adding enzyme BshC
MFTIDFKKLPNFQNLFLDYISTDEENYNRIKSFFYANYRENEEISKVIDNKIHNYNANRYFDKHTLIDILKRQNVTFGGNELTASNIELLSGEKTFAVVTGQQVGLYTGNFYTILKTITAIKLANLLKKKFSDFNFVPIFWLESEDHDLEEANHINLINRNNELVRLGFDDNSIGKEDEIHVEEARRKENEPEHPDKGVDASKKNTKPVGSIKFDESISKLNEQLKDALIDTDFKQKLIERINSFYCEGNDYKTSFAQFLNWIFKDYGLVFIDCNDKEIKKLLTPIFEKELNTSPKMCESIISTSAELEKKYDLQVKPKVINLFFIHNGNRLLIEPRDNNRFALRNSKRRFEHDELLNILFENPELFSPNVVLRPLCQDYLLPTVAYVGGPAEISYFAQLKPAYEHYDITMPIIYPRVSATILETKINKFLKNYDISFDDIFHHRKLVTKVVNKLSEIKIDEEIAMSSDEFNSIFYDLKKMTSSIDKTLVNTVDNLKEKLFQNLEMFKNKLVNAQAQKSETTTSQIDKVTNNIYPGFTLQERTINVTYFFNKYDDSFIKKLFEELNIEEFKHQVIEM